MRRRARTRRKRNANARSLELGQVLERLVEVRAGVRARALALARLAKVGRELNLVVGREEGLCAGRGDEG